MKLTEAQLCLIDYLNEQFKFDVWPEYKFTDDRQWKFDIAVPAFKWAIEIEGGAWSKGRHTRGKGFIADMEKYNRATADGWQVLRFTPQQVLDGTAMKFIQEYM